MEMPRDVLAHDISFRFDNFIFVVHMKSRTVKPSRSE